MYSFRMSFWRVPPNRSRGTPRPSATATYIASITAAGELMVMEVVTCPRSIPCNSRSMSSRESIATPQRPTSPWPSGSSESLPIKVGRSKATERPVCPSLRRNRYRSLVSAALPKPANCRMVNSLSRYIEV